MRAPEPLPDIYVDVEPQEDGSFDIVPMHRLPWEGPHVPLGTRTWRPTRRELKRLAREGRTPFDEATRRGQVALDALRAAAARDTELAEQTRRLL